MPPDAQTVHPGYGVPPEPRRRRINTWLEANGIDPRLVLADRPIYVLAVANGTIQGGLPWLIDIIVLHQYYEHPDGHRERNLITHEAVSFQRTVPLQVPFPADPTDDEGATDGEEQKVEAAEEDQRAPQHEGGAEEDERQAVRAAEEEEVQDRRSSSCPERSGEGRAERIEEHPEGDSREGHQAVPQPEEVRRQGKEVGEE